MGFIMRVCVKPKLLIVLCCALWLTPLSLRAACCTAQIQQAELVLENGHYQVSAEIDYYLSDKAMEALQNGVPLFWNILIRLQHPRDYLWSEILAEKVIRYRLQYHALLNVYRVKNETNGEIQNVSTFASAMTLMSSLNNFPLLDVSAALPDPNVVLAMKVEFDRNALPLPLRPLAYLSKQWYLSSDWTIWPLKK